MTQLQYPNRPTVSHEIQKNFEAITGVVNGDLRDDNIAEKAAIKGSKVADGSLPFSKLSPGINSGDILVWNGSAWVPQAQAPVSTFAANADKLDGLDSNNFLQLTGAPGSAIKAWWTLTAPQSSSGTGTTTHAHGLGKVPTGVWALQKTQGVTLQGVDSVDASNVVLHWNTVSLPGISVYLLVIG